MNRQDKIFTCNPSIVYGSAAQNSDDCIDVPAKVEAPELNITDDEKLIEAADKAWSELKASRKKAGRCQKCGSLLEMTAYGLKECEKCWS